MATRRRLAFIDKVNMAWRYFASKALSNAEYACAAFAFAKTLEDLDRSDALSDAIECAHREAYFTMTFTLYAISDVSPEKRFMCTWLSSESAARAIQALESALEAVESITTHESVRASKAAAVGLNLLRKSHMDISQDALFHKLRTPSITYAEYEALDGGLPEIEGFQRLYMRTDDGAIKTIPASLHAKARRWPRLLKRGSLHTLAFRLATWDMREKQPGACLFCGEQVGFMAKKEIRPFCLTCQRDVRVFALPAKAQYKGAL